MDTEDERINQLIQNRVTIAKRVLATDRELSAAVAAVDKARAAHAAAWREAREGGITERELTKQLKVARPVRGKAAGAGSRRSPRAVAAAPSEGTGHQTSVAGSQE